MNNPEDFKHFVEFYDWLELWPELSLAVGAVLLLLVDLFRKPPSGSAAAAQSPRSPGPRNRPQSPRTVDLLTIPIAGSPIAVRGA